MIVTWQWEVKSEGIGWDGEEGGLGRRLKVMTCRQNCRSATAVRKSKAHN